MPDTITSTSPDNPDDINKLIKSRLNAIFPSEEVRQKVLKLITENKERPDSYGPKSYSPYYTKHYGEQMRALADDQLTTFRDIVYDYRTFCTPWNKGGCSEQTLYNRVNQSRRYLHEKMDTEDCKYLNWKEMTRVKQTAGVGVVISIDPEILAVLKGEGDTIPKPRMAEPLINKPIWKEKLDNWIESDSEAPLFIRNLILTPEEQDKIRNELAGDRRIESLVTHSELRCIKINPDSV